MLKHFIQLVSISFIFCLFTSFNDKDSGLPATDLAKGGSNQLEICLSDSEYELYELLMAYRKEKGLPSIPLSKSLTNVAKVHAIDLSVSRPFNHRCNPHSWSKNPNWTTCCYTSDHKNMDCAQSKPQELTEYTGLGFEIVNGFSQFKTYQGQTISPEVTLSGWKSSKGHNETIINLGIWKKKKWKAIGVGMHRDFATVWFGTEEDPAGTVSKCIE